MKKNATQIKEDMLAFSCPKWNDFPDIDLYMDQIVEYINRALQGLAMEEPAVFITKSMVNNYVKNSMITPPIKKHYKQAHIGYLIVVCILKQCFSLNEVSEMIELYRTMGEDQIGLHYDRFIAIFENSIHEIFETDQLTYQLYTDPSNEQKLMDSAIKTVVHKIYTLYLLRKTEKSFG